MSTTTNLDILLTQNAKKLKENTYPGRGIFLGLTPDRIHFVQTYWIMGRSENSQNRLFVEENGFVKTDIFNPTKPYDPSLIIYYPVKTFNNYHIVTNGDQTETIMNALAKGKTFESALNERTYEPDPPNFTPRISGILDLDNEKYAYKLSILKSFWNNSNYCIRNIYNYETAIPGIGHCITTYASDGNPLPSFEGEPFIVRTFNNLEDTSHYYWNLLNPKNKVSLLVKFINKETKQTIFKIINKKNR